MHSLNLVEYYLIAGAALLLLSVIASKATGRLGVPALLVFLGIGMLAGSEGVGGIYFDNPFYAQTLGVIALVYILFAGGLSTELKQVRPVIKHGISLATLGIFFTCLITGVFTHYAFDFTWLEGFLLGAIVSSTDAAAVFTVLRGRSTHLKGNIKPLLELESGANDPMAVLLTVGILQLMTLPDSSPWMLILSFTQQIILGGTIGYISGKGTGILLNTMKLEFEGLYPVLTLAMILFVYGITQAVGGNGFLAVYIAGVILGNQNFVHKKSLILFHDGIAWLVQIAMFLALGLLVFPSRLVPVAGNGMLIAVFLILIARPLAVFISLMKTSFSTREKAMISWVGLRGSVPIILATYPYLAGVAKADEIFHLVFFIVITSILIQGAAIPFVAKLLKVDTPVKQKFRYPLEYVPTGDMRSDLIELDVPPKSQAIGRSIISLNLPKEALIVLIQRKGNVIVPKGGTHIEADDTMLVLAEKGPFAELKKIIESTAPKPDPQ